MLRSAGDGDPSLVSYPATLAQCIDGAKWASYSPVKRIHVLLPQNDDGIVVAQIQTPWKNHLLPHPGCKKREASCSGGLDA